MSKAFGGTEQSGIRDASVVIVGHGNVALDCARVLAKASPGLYDTDLAARALPVLGDGVATISIIGRRGHIQGAFTIKEVRELVKLEEEGHNTSFIVRADELDMGSTSASQSELQGPQGRAKTRIDKLLRKAASTGRCDGAGIYLLSEVLTPSHFFVLPPISINHQHQMLTYQKGLSSAFSLSLSGLSPTMKIQRLLVRLFARELGLRVTKVSKELWGLENTR